VTKSKRILAVASGGGHWVQLMRLRPAFEGHAVSYVTVDQAYATDLDGERLYVVPDSNLTSKFGLLRTALAVFWVVLRVRPDVVLSTGAAPGWFSLVFGRWFGARTVWLDSIANAERLSKSGAQAGRYADLWLTQWPELAQPDGPEFAGSVL
jgi:UDP-N-acetylglucosamine:LPS N-acetylglucosamine transferase